MRSCCSRSPHCGSVGRAAAHPDRGGGADLAQRLHRREPQLLAGVVQQRQQTPDRVGVVDLAQCPHRGEALENRPGQDVPNLARTRRGRAPWIRPRAGARRSAERGVALEEGTVPRVVEPVGQGVPCHVALGAPVRGQVFQMLQAIHVLWPPFLLAGMALAMRRRLDAEIERVIKNQRFLDPNRP